ncbi:hypothetical protein TSUD_295320 [Trifolium subterraneum]|uniref:F-box domain-containing protein n=1 Tax=Trifolium subterraneum TaxID=3900 RepID=A0A2Z6MU07_TRISU|nr:hypothetical protein TSUD_295320 [Trifolium subterraneum]
MERKRGSIPSARARKRGKRGKEKVDDIESQELGPSFADLPFPITTDILLRLSTKPILICKCVCRTWNKLISDPHFTKMHFERSSTGYLIRTCDPKLISRTMYLLEDEPLELDSECNNSLKLEPTLKLPLRGAKLDLDKRGTTDGLLVCKPKDHKFDVANSCNGFVCLCDPINKDPLLVCNPVTGEFIRLPKVPTSSKITQRAVCSGIGLQPKTNKYKVVRIGDFNEIKATFIEINVVGTPTWRIVGARRIILVGRLEHPTFLNETLHWIMFEDRKFSILCFNFETEKLHFIYFPSSRFLVKGILHKECISMGTLRDSLYVCNASSPSSMQVWIMKKYDNTVSWTLAFTLSREPHRGISVFWLVKHFEKGTAILDYHSKKGFTYYDPETNRSKKFLVCGTEEKLLEVIPHIPSLISLKDVAKGKNVKVLNVNSQ